MRPCASPYYKSTTENIDSCVLVCPSGIISTDGATCMPNVQYAVLIVPLGSVSSASTQYYNYQSMFPCNQLTQLMQWVGQASLPQQQCLPFPTTNQILKTITITGAPTAIYGYATQPYTTLSTDIYGNTMVSPIPVITWSVGAVGDAGAATITSTTGILTGLYSGYITVIATSGTVSGKL